MNTLKVLDWSLRGFLGFGALFFLFSALAVASPAWRPGLRLAWRLFGRAVGAGIAVLRWLGGRLFRRRFNPYRLPGLSFRSDLGMPFEPIKKLKR